MKIIITSDTHNEHEKLDIPKCDLFIHCGDSTKKGSKKEIEAFLKWVSNIKSKYKIIISGNHDDAFESKPHWVKSIMPNNIIYLQDSSVELDGLKIYGSPAIPMRKIKSSSVFKHSKEFMPEIWRQIPVDTDILITHTPPKGILDLSKKGDLCGCNDLKNRLNDLNNLKLHCFGHIHESYGVKKIENTTFVNAAFLNGRYEEDDAYIEIEL